MFINFVYYTHLLVSSITMKGISALINNHFKFITQNVHKFESVYTIKTDQYSCMSNCMTNMQGKRLGYLHRNTCNVLRSIQIDGLTLAVEVGLFEQGVLALHSSSYENGGTVHDHLPPLGLGHG